MRFVERSWSVAAARPSRRANLDCNRRPLNQFQNGGGQGFESPRRKNKARFAVLDSVREPWAIARQSTRHTRRLGIHRTIGGTECGDGTSSMSLACIRSSRQSNVPGISDTESLVEIADLPIKLLSLGAVTNDPQAGFVAAGR